VIAKDVTEPSPLAMEILSARPYAYLDDAPLEERRTQAVIGRRWLDPESAGDLGRLDADAIARVREEAWPAAETPDELHDALMWLGALTAAEMCAGANWEAFAAQLQQQRRVTRIAVPRGFAESSEALVAGGGDVSSAAVAGATLWIAVERLPQWRAVAPGLHIEHEVVVPREFADVHWEREVALTEIVRGRLEGLGPVTAAQIGSALGLSRSDIDGALLRLEAEGFAMRGSFTPGAGETEWCERRLLARIHRYTVKRLRAEIEPVSAADCMRFLLHWQHVAHESIMSGPDAVAAIIGQCEGFEAPAAAWETEILPARVSDYEPEWLDELCLKGRAAWMRLSRPRVDAASGQVAAPVRMTPITLLTRRNAQFLAALAANGELPPMRSSTRAVYDHLASHGASFFDEIVEGSRQLRTHVEEAIGELVSLGLVSSDSFIGLRALLLPVDRRKPIDGGRRRRRSALFGIEDAGRWTLIRRRATAPEPGIDVADQAARMLLKRYGIVFWRLLEREAQWLPPWRDLLRALRRLEARGEIRGGRFVAGFSGEQFALPEAVNALREVRRLERRGMLTALSGADPLNLAGILTPGPKVAALTGNRMLYRDGIPIAWLTGGTVGFADALPVTEQRATRDALIRRHALAPALSFLA